VTVPTGAPTTSDLTAQQIQVILMRQRLGLPTAGLLVPLVPTWQLMIRSGLGRQTPGLAAALTGRPALDFVPIGLRTPPVLEAVERFPSDEVEVDGEEARPSAGPTTAEPRSAPREPGAERLGRPGFTPSQQEQIGAATGPAVAILGDLLIAADRTKSSTE
jgi:hypothetical protein